MRRARFHVPIVVVLFCLCTADSAASMPKRILADTTSAPIHNLLPARPFSATYQSPANRYPVGRGLGDTTLWDLTRADGYAEFYDHLRWAPDTMAVVLTPLAPCIIKGVYAQFFVSGTIEVLVAEYGDASQISPDGRCEDIPRNTTQLSPIGRHLTPLVANAVTQSFEYIDPLDVGGEVVVGDSTHPEIAVPFVVAFTNKAADMLYLFDDTSDRDGVTYTWMGGIQGGGWGRFSTRVELMCLVQVTYPWGIAPQLTGLKQLSDTYVGAAAREVTVAVFDDLDDRGVGIDNGDILNYHYVVAGDTVMGDLDPLDIDTSGNGLYRFEIPTAGLPPGDSVIYWVSGRDQNSIEGESERLSFRVVAPIHPDADLLIISDQANPAQSMYKLYETVMDSLGITYEFWDVNAHGGIAPSVIHYGWDNILVYGNGSRTVPLLAGDEDPGYAAFLERSGNLILIDQDWLFAYWKRTNFISPWPDSLEFQCGDFAYDYFGLAGIYNDPSYRDGYTSADTALLGTGTTPLDSSFVDLPLRISHSLYGTSNWGDFLAPASATPLFIGADSGQVMAVSNRPAADPARRAQTVYLAFMADAAVELDTAGNLIYPQLRQLLAGLRDYFNIRDRRVIVEGKLASDIRLNHFLLAPNYPNPFNPTTTIRFDLPMAGSISLVVYDLSGREVIRLVDGHKEAGYHQVSWNGRDGFGRDPASGVYIYRLVTSQYHRSRKMLLLK